MFSFLIHLVPHLVPLLSIAGYLLYPKQIRINQIALYYISVAHNSTLILFSAWTCVSISQIVYNEGLVFQSNYYFQNSLFDKIIFYFYLSKYYEFGDTFLLYLHGKSPLFLQKYHHVGAVISWHLMYYYKVDAIWNITLLNAFIHTIMYSYYLGCLLKIRQVKIIKQYITTLQLIQFGIMYVNMYLYWPPVVLRFKYNIIIIFAIYGVGVVGLFISFYYKNYACSRIKMD